MTFHSLRSRIIINRPSFFKNTFKNTTIRSITTTRSCYHNNNNNSNNNKNTTSNIGDSPFSAIANGIESLRTSLLNNSPLRHVTKPTLETLPFTGEADSWYKALREAQGLVKTDNQDRMMDPVKLLGKDVWELKGNIKKLLGSGHPFMKTLAKHYLSSDTERIRPLLVLLMAQATSTVETKDHILATQRRLAEISEMIHISSLLHYDILDDNENAKNVFGNKMAVLAGDFLLARASLALAQLRNAECIELMATCIANLVEGEVMQEKKNHHHHFDNYPVSELSYYLEQSYLKTASLIAQSCKSSVVLGGADNDVAIIAYDYGKNVGMAIQLINDIQVFAKKAANMDNIPINAPLLFASEEFSELKQLIKGNFADEGDLEKARNLVYQSNGLKRTLELADTHKLQAIESIQKLPSSKAQQALIQLAKNVGN
ncbi:isoprenoid synthase domain-containing protein [Cunninghamella echinulata]|nr:isoprenoid synthase domain-containing protein [Cunninghamella echinulata]